MTTWRDQIESKPDVLSGKPCIRGTRLSVEHVIGLLAQGRPTAELLGAYPGLTPDQLQPCPMYAAQAVAKEQLFPVEA